MLSSRDPPSNKASYGLFSSVTAASRYNRNEPMPLQTKAQRIALASTRFPAALERRVLSHIGKEAIFRAGEHILVGVSGGPDSTALLVILARLRADLDVPLTAAN